MSASPAVRGACRSAERLGYIRGWQEIDGRVHVIPRFGPPQLVRSVREVDRIVLEARRRMVVK